MPSNRHLKLTENSDIAECIAFLTAVPEDPGSIPQGVACEKSFSVHLCSSYQSTSYRTVKIFSMNFLVENYGSERNRHNGTLVLRT